VTKRSNLILLAIAMLLALFTTFVVISQISHWKANQSGEQTAAVIVVDKPVSAHTLISAGDVSLQPIAKSAVQSGAMTSLNEVVGHFASSNWYAGQQVIPAMILADSTPAAFPVQIPVGDRAYTVANDPVTGVDHLISPGDHVDVLATYGKDTGTQSTAVILLQDVLVLHVDNLPSAQASQATVNSTSSQASTDSKTGVDTLTVAINPHQTVVLDYAETFGKLHVVLRNPNDSGLTTAYSAP
jgi:Flp pilus assembly protein CpaB